MILHSSFFPIFLSTYNLWLLRNPLRSVYERPYTTIIYASLSEIVVGGGGSNNKVFLCIILYIVYCQSVGYHPQSACSLWISISDTSPATIATFLPFDRTTTLGRIHPTCQKSTIHIK